MHAERRLAAAMLVTLAMVAAPATAQAFCRTRTVVAPPDFDPGAGCFAQGQPLYHASQCVPYHLLAAESPRISRTILSNSLARAFGAWTAPNPTCAPGIAAIELAPVPDTVIASYTTGQHGHNVIGVVDGPWPHAGASDTLSLATLTFDANTGEVFDADLEIRSDVAWSFGATPPADGYDLDAVMTHETGHILGLGHSPVVEAVMFPTYTPGSITQRKLVTDDQQGICAIYPDRQTRVTGTAIIASSACDLSPGTSGSSCGDPAITHGCAVGSERGGGEGSWLAALGAMAAVAWRTRKRRNTGV